MRSWDWNDRALARVIDDDGTSSAAVATGSPRYMSGPVWMPRCSVRTGMDGSAEQHRDRVAADAKDRAVVQQGTDSRDVFGCSYVK